MSTLSTPASLSVQPAAAATCYFALLLCSQDCTTFGLGQEHQTTLHWNNWNKNNGIKDPPLDRFLEQIGKLESRMFSVILLDDSFIDSGL